MIPSWWWETAQVIGAFAAVANTILLVYLAALTYGIARREKHYLEIIKQYASIAGMKADESSGKLEQVGKDVKETARKVDDLAGTARPKPTNSATHT